METTKLGLLRNAMQAYEQRMQATNTNIANLDTPGYQRKSVSFEDELQNVRYQVPSLRNVTDVKARMQVDEDAPILEDEMMELADTQMRTQLATRALREHFDLMRTGITGQPS